MNPQDKLLVEALVGSQDPADWTRAAADIRLTSDLALALLSKRDLPASALEALSRNASVLKHRPVLQALVAHPRTPRYISFPILRRLFTFELMQIALAPAVAADVKVACDEALISRLSTISAGERSSLAKQGSRRIAAALLHDSEARIVEAALNNPRLTEVEIVKALKHENVPQHLIKFVGKHEKWKLRTEVQVAMLQCEHTPLATAITAMELLGETRCREALMSSKLPSDVRNYLEAKLNRSSGQNRKSESDDAV